MDGFWSLGGPQLYCVMLAALAVKPMVWTDPHVIFPTNGCTRVNFEDFSGRSLPYCYISFLLVMSVTHGAGIFANITNICHKNHPHVGI